MLRGVHLGATGGPLSLLLLPKCPLCLMPLLATLGITAVPTSRTFFAAAALFCAGWLAFIVLLGRRERRIVLAAIVLAAGCALAIVARSTMLLSASAVAMAIVGFHVSRTCVNGTCSSLDTSSPRA